MFGSVGAIFLVQRNDNLAITVGLEAVGNPQVLAQDSMVVDFAVDGQRNGSIVIDKRLSSAVHTHYTKAFVAEDGVVASPVSRPVRATVPQAFYTLQGSGLEGGYRRMAIDSVSKARVSKCKMDERDSPVAGEDTTHGCPQASTCVPE